MQEGLDKKIQNLARTSSKPILKWCFVRRGQYNSDIEFGECIYEERINQRSPCRFMGAILFQKKWLFTAERMSYTPANKPGYICAFYENCHYTFCSFEG
jgi:hypothetical protein